MYEIYLLFVIQIIITQMIKFLLNARNQLHAPLKNTVHLSIQILSPLFLVWFCEKIFQAPLLQGFIRSNRRSLQFLGGFPKMTN